MNTIPFSLWLSTKLCIYMVMFHEAKLIITTAGLKAGLEQLPELTQGLEMSELTPSILVRSQGIFRTFDTG